MNAETDQALLRAYELIEQERLDEAQVVLKPILAQEQDNSDAWWLYAHAVTDANTARDAIQNVLRVDPNYPDARELLETLEASLASVRPVRPIERIGTETPVVPPTLPDHLPDETVQTEPRHLLGTRQIAILLPILLIVIVGGLLILLNSAPPGVSSVTSTPEEQAVIPTLPVTTPSPEATSAPTVEQTVEQILPTVTTVTTLVTDAPMTTSEVESTAAATIPTEGLTSDNNFDALYEALGAFTVPRNGVEISETSLGTTLVATICTNTGPELRTDLNNAMGIIADNSADWTTLVDAIAARMVNCGTNNTLLLIGVAIEDAAAYANGALDEGEFQSRWVSQ